MSFHDTIKALQNWFHSLVSDLKPALDFLESKGGPAILALAEGVLTEEIAGTPWAAIGAKLVETAKADGKDLLENDAQIILNIAKANLLAKGQPSA